MVEMAVLMYPDETKTVVVVVTRTMLEKEVAVKTKVAMASVPTLEMARTIALIQLLELAATVLAVLAVATLTTLALICKTTAALDPLQRIFHICRSSA
jgi:hypothetical protein